MSNSEEGTDLATFNEESCGTILQVAKELYQDELDRYKQIENKTAITLTFIGIVIVFLINDILSSEITIINVKVTSLLFGFELLILTGFFVSIIYLLISIAVSDFQQVKIDEIVNIKDATSDPAQVKINIAATYQNIVNHNMQVINTKAERYGTGIVWTKYSFIVFSISLLIKGVILYVLQ